MSNADRVNSICLYCHTNDQRRMLSLELAIIPVLGGNSLLPEPAVLYQANLVTLRRGFAFPSVNARANCTRLYMCRAFMNNLRLGSWRDSAC